MEFRTLRADEIDVRVGQVKSTGYTLLLYKDARCDMNILDEHNVLWQRDHKEIKGNLYCGVGIYVEPIGWVWKWDCGTESNTEKEKGEASDSFKRACVNWGIGRELYTSPFIYVMGGVEEDKDHKFKYVLTKEEKKRSFKVKEIEYNEKREITKLVIVDTKGAQVYPSGYTKTPNVKPASEFNKFTREEKQKAYEKATVGSEVHCCECDEKVSDKVAKYSLDKFGRVLCFNCQKLEGTKIEEKEAFTGNKDDDRLPF